MYRSSGGDARVGERREKRLKSNKMKYVRSDGSENE